MRRLLHRVLHFKLSQILAHRCPPGMLSGEQGVRSMVRSPSRTCQIATATSVPGGQQLNYGGRNEGNRTFGYIGTRKKCGPCQQRSQCTTGPFRYLAIYMNEGARQRARDLWTTLEFKYAQRQRKK